MSPKIVTVETLIHDFKISAQKLCIMPQHKILQITQLERKRPPVSLIGQSLSHREVSGMCDVEVTSVGMKGGGGAMNARAKAS
jgi:hypothetical protein